VGYPMALFVWS